MPSWRSGRCEARRYSPPPETLAYDSSAGLRIIRGFAGFASTLLLVFLRLAFLSRIVARGLIALGASGLLIAPLLVLLCRVVLRAVLLLFLRLGTVAARRQIVPIGALARLLTGLGIVARCVVGIHDNGLVFRFGLNVSVAAILPGLSTCAWQQPTPTL
jgi:hypothetical protein